MKTEDKYEVKLVNGYKHYRKNGKLHREAGPALVHPNDFDKYTDLADKDLYKEIPVKEKKLKVIVGETKTGTTNLQSINAGNNNLHPSIANILNNLPQGKAIVTFESPVEYYYHPISEYYLEGILHTEKEFNAIILKKKMEIELDKSTNLEKKLKI